MPMPPGSRMLYPKPAYGPVLRAGGGEIASALPARAAGGGALFDGSVIIEREANVAGAHIRPGDGAGPDEENAPERHEPESTRPAVIANGHGAGTTL